MKSILISLSSIIIFILVSCNNGNPVGTVPQKNYSNLSIGFSMDKAPSNIWRIEGILSRQGYDTLSSDFKIFNDSAVCEFNNIPSGLWHLRVNAYDSTNTVKYSGETDINVIAGMTIPVNLTLNPATGSIYITVSWGKPGINLIANPDFEINGLPSLNGWVINDTSWVKLVKDAPDGNGKWSLSIVPPFGPAPGGMASTSITGQNGSSSYTLSFLEKNTGTYFWGIVSVKQKRNGDIIFNTSVSADTSRWTLFSKTFDLSLQPSDTLTITLQSLSLALKAGNKRSINIDTEGIMYDGISLIKD